MKDNSNASDCGSGFFKMTLNIGTNLPGTVGDSIYASASVDTIGIETDAPSGYLTWKDYDSNIPNYPVAIKNPKNMVPVKTTLTSLVNESYSTTMAASYPPIINTLIAQTVPEVLETTITKTDATLTSSIQIKNTTDIVPGMAVFGGVTGKGNVFPGGTVVKSITGTTVTLSILYLAPGVASGAAVKFTGAITSTTIKVTDATGIEQGMTPFGGIPKGNGFAPNTVVNSVNEKKITLSEATLPNSIVKNAPVQFNTTSKTGTSSIKVKDVSKIKKGMIPSGGMANGNCFTATTTVTNIDVPTNTITLSEVSVNPIIEGEAINFTPAFTNKIIVSSSTNIIKGMSVFGGASKDGDGFGPDAFVTNIDANTITISELTAINNLVPNTPISFFPPLPSQKIGVIGTANTVSLCIPNDKVLSGGRIIFSLKNPGNFPFNSAHQPTAPVPYKGNVTDNYYDFVEFAWTFPSKGKTNINYDTSIVDQFGFPITIEFGTTPIMKRGIEIPRATVISNYKTNVPTTISTKYTTLTTPSPVEVSSFFNGLATIMSPYRILAPADAFLLADEVNATASFKALVKGVSTYFDTQIETFFDTYDRSLKNNSNATFYISNVGGPSATGKGGGGLHDLSGYVKTIKQTATDGTLQSYRVLSLTDITPGITAADGLNWEYTIYEPFFSSNGYPSKPAPPKWLTNGSITNNKVVTLIPTSESPTAMVFGASGVFADSGTSSATCQPTPSGATSKAYQILLGAIENQFVTAINRGVVLAPQWRWLYQSPNNSATQPPTPQVTVNKGKTVTISKGGYVPVFKGMSIIQQAGTAAIAAGTAAAPNTVTDVAFDGTSGITTITLSIDNIVQTATPNIVVCFSYENIACPFYELNDPMSGLPFGGASFNNNGIWNYFSQFFHAPYDASKKTGISIDGLAYAYAFDDQGNFSTDISKDNPVEAIINIGTN